jgi:hypothetical protein
VSAVDPVVRGDRPPAGRRSLVVTVTLKNGWLVPLMTRTDIGQVWAVSSARGLTEAARVKALA